MEPQNNNSNPGPINNSEPDKPQSPIKNIAPVASSFASNIASGASNTVSSIGNSASSMADKMTTPLKNPMTNGLKPQKQGRIKKLLNSIKTKWQSLNKWKKAAVIIIALLVVTGIAAGAYLAFFKNSTKPVAQKTTVAAVVKPTTAASPLTGIQVQPELAKRPVTGIMIENSTDSRPQSGMQEAGVIIEAVAEGGITRFMSLFQETSPQYVGPVRSLRPYYLDFAAAFQASIVHVGGSPEALSRVRNGNYRDLDQFFNSGAFSRVSSRAAPHNVYTSFEKLDALNQSKGYTTSTFTSWARKDDAKMTTPTAKSIDLAISSYYFNVHYDYDVATNTYLRSNGGSPHKNLVSATDKTGVQLSPKVVIALVMPYGIHSDGQHSDYKNVGTGNAYIFQDGGVTVGKWTRSSAEAQVALTDTAGAVIKLNAGQAWITLLGSDTAVTYTAPAPVTPVQ